MLKINLKTPKPSKNKGADEITPAKVVIPLRKIKNLKLASNGGLNKKNVIGSTKIPEGSPVKCI